MLVDLFGHRLAAEVQGELGIADAGPGRLTRRGILLSEREEPALCLTDEFDIRKLDRDAIGLAGGLGGRRHVQGWRVGGTCRFASGRGDSGVALRPCASESRLFLTRRCSALA